ncbi:pyridoxine kinase [Cordyceps fumosorosea ARSEF 2679]|uniref:pyridoxal kinase n=1 Tax=Cordyceps fumosorosea (strain ARSEF 2679) TaxID=1081104 RepID=A0A162LNV2_CORFA|nr:pyridoxine kinase [Cordyceps fumosorosea ARSEF 2679]OAA73474.1 pyridoxine kinase [Cordyceps fumosorosea ARSEF 2679]
MSAAPIVPPTRVLAVASHVVSGYVGNKVAVFVLQSLGCDTAALNTVQFSNHTGYRHWTGTKATAQEISDLYRGLKDNYINDFDMMLSGYIPGAEGVLAVGDIAKELKATNNEQPGNFFWVLDPVMGDNGNLYVAADVVPAYKSLLSYADLIIPNQFEAELLSGVKITDMDSLAAAIQAFHDTHRVPHVVITSVSLSSPDIPADHLCVVGSSMTSTGRARLFKAVFPSIDCYFCGTGDMFGALVTVRMREAAAAADVTARANWVSDDDVAPADLPLARATEKVLASMHEVLTHTRNAMPGVVERTLAAMATEEERGGEKQRMLAGKKAAELQLVRNLDCLRSPRKKIEVRPF